MTKGLANVLLQPRPVSLQADLVSWHEKRFPFDKVQLHVSVCLARKCGDHNSMNPNRRPSDRRCCGRRRRRRYRLPAAQPSRIVSHCRRRRCLLVVRCSTGRRVHVIFNEILDFSQVLFETHIDTRRLRDVHLNPHLDSLALSCFTRRH